MVKHQNSQLDAAFHALGDTTRRAMLRELARGERTVSELAAPFNMSLAGASKHIRVLEDAGFIEREVQGRTHLCRLRAKPLKAIRDWMRFYENFWGERLDALAQALEQSEEKKR